jgi:LPXTG-motif cell wall-anchored protein
VTPVWRGLGYRSWGARHAEPELPRDHACRGLAEPGSPDLAETGSSSATPIIGGAAVVVLLAGGGIMWSVRKRRTAQG